MTSSPQQLIHFILLYPITYLQIYRSPRSSSWSFPFVARIPPGSTGFTADPSKRVSFLLLLPPEAFGCKIQAEAAPQRSRDASTGHIRQIHGSGTCPADILALHENALKSLEILMGQLLLIGSRSNGYDGLSQSPCLSRMDGLSVPELPLPFSA